MIRAERAPVEPMVASPDSGDAIRLTDVIESILDRRVRSVIQIAGGSGSGKSTALRHVAATFDSVDDLDFVDESYRRPDQSCLQNSAVLVCTSDTMCDEALRLNLTPWTRDECIEYLLAMHADQCASVMGRLARSDDGAITEGCPEVWRFVLDRMAHDTDLNGVRDAIAPLLAQHLDACGSPIDPVLRRLIRRRSVRRLLDAERIVRDLESLDLGRLSREITTATGAEVQHLLATRPDAVAGLRGILDHRMRRKHHSMAATLLYAFDPTWAPRHFHRDLQGARLQGVCCSAIRWRKIRLAGADLDRADLSGAQMKAPDLSGASLRHANLEGAMISDAVCAKTDFSHANLTAARIDHGDLGEAILRRATLDGCTLQGTDLDYADLRGASFVGANLEVASLSSARIAGADFTDAILDSTVLDRVSLRLAVLDGASFKRAQLIQADLEGACLHRPDFSFALLRGAHFTDTTFDAPNFQHARLTNAGLAGISWVGADLRNADFTHAAFHLGTTRSGLVGSPVAGEGSRTGFYTDDTEEKYFKSPDELRKADLRHADLRGAHVEDADFYLVDLRGARFDEIQRDHFRRCRAILDDD